MADLLSIATENESQNDLKIYEDRLKQQMEKDGMVLAFVTATKPDFYKQAPVVKEAVEEDMPVFILHTGQHYDELLGHGLEEYGVEENVAVNLGIRGGLSEKTAQVHRRIKLFADYLESEWPEKTVLPIVHGDTHAAGIIPQAWMFATNQAVAHNEAGLRSMSPSFENIENPGKFVEDQWDEEKWSVNRAEPFPEQYDTFIGSAASVYHFAPVKLNREHLEREAYPRKVSKDDRIEVVGNSVVNAIKMKTNEALEETIFDIYPVLEEKDDWIRVDIHRRANLLEDRFKAIVNAVIQLVENGHNVNFVELNATKKALKEYGLRDKLVALDENRENFLFTGLWKKHAHVYEFLESGQCLAELTDSGSMQEELNYIDETICLTARFNTDRPETVFESKTNLLVPPVESDFMREMVEYVINNSELREEIQKGPNLYGENPAKQIVSFLQEKDDEAPFDWAHDRTGFQLSGENLDYL